MKALGALLFISALLLPSTPVQSQDRPPDWAYPVNPPDFKPPPDDGKPKRVPGSTLEYSTAQTRDLFFAPDWHPNEHPPMPEIVARGRKPDVMACGLCHRADGPGGPENANVAGLPFDYIVQQMADFKSGARSTALPERLPQKLMIALAKAATEAEVQAAAAYFSSVKPRVTIKVLESETAPKTYVAGWFFADTKTGEREPLGNRIIEVPEDVDQFLNRDSHAQFIAYVPPGSVKKGEELARTGGNGKTLECAACHGADLKGSGVIPGIAGRSPTYSFRQLYEYKHGMRAGAQSETMKPVVEKLTLDDMIALAVYAASLPP